MATSTPARFTVRMPLEKKLDRQIDICRLGARKDRVAVVIEREVKHKGSGTIIRREPVIEITPDGDVREFDAPRLRTRMHTAIANDRMQQLAAEATRMIEADRRRKDAKRGKRKARRSATEVR